MGKAATPIDFARIASNLMGTRDCSQLIATELAAHLCILLATGRSAHATGILRCAQLTRTDTMSVVKLSTALTGAAEHVYKKLRTLDDPAAWSQLSEEFLQRWLVLSDDPLTLNASEASGSYFFLLWKNFSVTNISVSELAALLRTYAKSRSTNRRLQVDFTTTEDYKAFLTNLWQSVFSEKIQGRQSRIKNKIRKAVSSIVAFHSNFFEQTIIFDMYFTSVFVFIPRSLKIDIGAVTRESGYVHSAGIAIYWPAPGSEDTELGVLMELEVGHGEAEVYARVQA